MTGVDITYAIKGGGPRSAVCSAVLECIIGEEK